MLCRGLSPGYVEGGTVGERGCVVGRPFAWGPADM